MTLLSATVFGAVACSLAVLELGSESISNGATSLPVVVSNAEIISDALI